MLAHNVFKRTDERCPDDTEIVVRKTSTTVTYARAKARWDELAARAADMQKTAACTNHHQVKVEIGDQCNAFGGCPYLSICTHRETPNHYRRRVLRLALQKEEGSSMSLEEKLAKAKKKGKPTPPETGINSPEAKEPETNAKEISPVKEKVVPLKKKKKTKTKKEAHRLTILQGCFPVRAPARIMFFPDLIHIAVKDLGGWTPEVFYAKPAYERGQLLASIAQAVREALEQAGVDYLIVPARVSSEGQNLLEALTPLADHVFVGAA